MKPADLLDQAAEAAEANLQAAIEAARQTRTPGLVPKGACYYCDEKLEGLLRFCDEHCAQDYEYLMERRRINGIKP